jgi:hypothetical protein
MLEATLAYGVSRQTIMQRVKRGELQAVHLRTGRRKGLLPGLIRPHAIDRFNLHNSSRKLACASVRV